MSWAIKHRELRRRIDICKDGSVIFTSDRDGDLELYRMNLDGSGSGRLTTAPGYDGGAFFRKTPTVDRPAGRPSEKTVSVAEANEMKSLLPSTWSARPWSCGSPMPMAKKCPPSPTWCRFVCTVLLPGQRGRRAKPPHHLFLSNNGDPARREFDLWAINADGSQLEQITCA